MIDANLALYALDPSAPQQTQVLALFAQWRDEGRALLAPCLWSLEVASGLRKMASAGILTSEEAQTLLDLFLTWEVKVYGNDGELLQSAYAWAERIGHRVIYDSLYLALAERQGGEFWTGDKRLYNSARQAGADFVRLLGNR
ncbi:MAG: type II toxin-antitoxin system VapC family toxin [Chloroflexi bacterium]|nr:type II toxin-antitoxin system VapC family toxin [Chloroflexota bacterium]